MVTLHAACPSFDTLTARLSLVDSRCFPLTANRKSLLGVQLSGPCLAPQCQCLRCSRLRRTGREERAGRAQEAQDCWRERSRLVARVACPDLLRIRPFLPLVTPLPTPDTWHPAPAFPLTLLVLLARAGGLDQPATRPTHPSHTRTLPLRTRLPSQSVRRSRV